MRQQIVFGLFLIAFSLLKVEFQAQTLPSYVPSNGLVGWWPFNGNANDESGNGNHGTVNGATLTMDRNGNTNSAFSFNGINNKISFVVLPELNDFTYSIFFKIESSTNDYKRILDLDNASDSYLSIHASPQNTCGIHFRQNNVQFGLTSEDVISNNQWHHIVFKRFNSQGYLYLDGILKFQISISNTPFYVNALLTIGHTDLGGYPNQYFQGCLDDVAIYNRALTQEEITDLYTGSSSIAGCTNSIACNYNAAATQDDGSCTFPAQTYLTCDGNCINDTDADGICDEMETPTIPSYIPSNGLVGYWPFNGNANDESGNGNHGTVNGATLTADRNGNANSAYSFDGVNDLINAGNPPQLGNNPASYTQVVWARFSDFPSGIESSYPIVSRRHVDNGEDWATPLLRSSQVIWFFADDSYYDNGPIASSINIELSIWYFFVFVKDGSSYKLFVNGTLVNEIYDDHLMDGSGSNLIFGAQLAWPQYLKGFLDDIAIYNRALTQEEITALYTRTSSNNGGGGSGSIAGTPAASVPAGIPYQAVIRDNAGAALVNTPVTVRFTLHENTTSGTTEYQETQSLTTNTLGLINTQFGAGTATQGTFAGINWSNTTKFIQVEANTGAGYVDMGTQQMMSVPFAIKCNEANKVKNAGLPVYADNAAALAGGLVAGEMYRTANGDLKIVF